MDNNFLKVKLMLKFYLLIRIKSIIPDLQILAPGQTELLLSYHAL